MSQFEESLFEGRNRAYGAYSLRKGNSGHVLKAFIVAILLVFSGFAIPLVLRVLKEREVKDEPIRVTQKKIVNYSQLSAPPPIELKPPPKQSKIEKPKSTLKYVKPVVKPDEEVVDEIPIPTQEELEFIDPGLETIEGIDTIVFDEPEIIAPPPQEEPVLFAMVEKQPEFPGGEEALVKFFSDNIRYPELARTNDIWGRVVIQFVIDADGSVSDVIVLKDIGGGCGEEAVRVATTMPEWSPAEQNGRKVPVKFMMPVSFKLRR